MQPVTSKTAIIELIHQLDDVSDRHLLDGIETLIKRSDIETMLAAVRLGALSHLDTDSWNFFKTTIASKTLNFGVLQQYFALLSDVSAKIGKEHFVSASCGSLFDVIPEQLKSNQVFMATLPQIMQYSAATASGMGAGELFFLIYGKSATKVHSTVGADVCLDGWNLEIKSTGSGLKSVADNESEGGVKSKQGAKSRVVDGLNNELKTLAQTLGFKIANQHQAPNLTTGWFPEFWRMLEQHSGRDQTVAKMNHYLGSLYNWRNPTLSSEAILDALGKSHANRVWAAQVIGSNKKNSGWDSVLIINTKNEHTLEFANFLTGEDIPENVALWPFLQRGGSTYAYPDGFINLDLYGARSSTDYVARCELQAQALVTLQRASSSLTVAALAAPSQSMAEKLNEMQTVIHHRQTMIQDINSNRRVFDTRKIEADAAKLILTIEQMSSAS